jgi:hypothetical protein
VVIGIHKRSFKVNQDREIYLTCNLDFKQQYKTVKRPLFSAKGFPNTKLMLSLLLFGWAVSIFPIVNEYVFSPVKDANHIIDSHLQEEWLDGFFDSRYVQAAGERYIKERYIAYYILDVIFPFIYTSAFFLMAIARRKRIEFKIFRTSLIACLVLDLLENSSFFIYLYNKDVGLAFVVSVFTTFKSVLFLLNLLFALFAFLFPGKTPLPQRAKTVRSPVSKPHISA